MIAIIVIIVIIIIIVIVIVIFIVIIIIIYSRKKWEPGNLVPSRLSGQVRKAEARLGKLAKIRKVETN